MVGKFQAILWAGIAAAGLILGGCASDSMEPMDDAMHDSMAGTMDSSMMDMQDMAMEEENPGTMGSAPTMGESGMAVDHPHGDMGDTMKDKEMTMDSGM